jgi:hypothetical protein
VTYVQESLCWAEFDLHWSTLGRETFLRQKSLVQCLESNRQLFFNFKPASAGWLGFLHALIYEGMGPGIELLSYVSMVALYLSGLIDLYAFATFWLFVLGLEILHSIVAVFQDMYNRYEYIRLINMMKIVFAVLLETILYRQLTVFWRGLGLVRPGLK